MLVSLPRSRSIVEISYGCIGRSVRQLSTASASGFDTRRRVVIGSPRRLLEVEYSHQGTWRQVTCGASTVRAVNPMPLPPRDDGPEVGDFTQGTGTSRWALGRYLVGRAIGELVGRGLLVFALVVAGVAALVYWIGPTWFAVLIGLVAVSVLVLRWMLGAVLRRFTGADHFGPMEARMRALVADT